MSRQPPKASRPAGDIIRIGTRGSPLALRQAEIAAGLILKNRPDIKVKNVIIKTSGDRFFKKPLSSLASSGRYSGKGLFVKEIEDALLERRVDIAVHSLKDVPASLPDGLQLTAYLKRDDPYDLFISARYRSFKEMPRRGVVGTSSPRRAAQILALRPDIRIVPLRGNVETRLAKLNDGACDATVLAAAGIKRLGLLKKIGHLNVLRLGKFIPAIGQGIICVESRSADRGLNRFLRASLNHGRTEKEASAERAFLKRIGGDCHTPIAAHASFKDGSIIIHGLLASPDGRKRLKMGISGRDPLSAGNVLGDMFIKAGGRKIIGLQRFKGKKILLTQLRSTAKNLAGRFKEEGGRVINLPLIRISGPSDDFKSMDSAVQKLGEYDWLVFTSRNAVEKFASRERLQKKRPRKKVPKTAVVGEATAKKASLLGYHVDLVSSASNSAALAESLLKKGKSGLKVLFPRAKDGLDILPDLLSKGGIKVDVVEAYQTLPARIDVKKWTRRFGRKRPDVIVFASPSAVRAYVENFGKRFIDDSVEIIAVGGTTETEAARHGLFKIASRGVL